MFGFKSEPLRLVGFLPNIGLLFLFGSLDGLATYASETEPYKPNVIIILADDLGYADLSCYGKMRLPTPNCDRLAREGMLFTDMHSASAVCTPSRYSLLTGRYAWRTWLKDWVLNTKMPLLIKPERLTLQRLFRNSGYKTGCVGKWHLGWGREPLAYQKGTMKPGPIETGFDYYFGMPFSHNSRGAEMNVYVRNSEVVGLKQGESIMEPAVYGRLQRDLDETAQTLSEDAVDFIERNKDQPFFLYYAMAHVHTPLTPQPRFQGASGLGRYSDFVIEMDWAVGEILDTLDRLDLTDSTLIFFTSDNGSVYRRSNDPWRGIKGEVYEGGHRVPFLARWPGVVPAGSINSDPLCHTDIMRTCSKILDSELPPDAAEDSASFFNELRGEKSKALPRDRIVHHSVLGVFALREGPWKLIKGVGGGRDHGGESLELPFGIHLHDETAVPQIDEETGEVRPWSFEPIFQRPKLGEPPEQLYNLRIDPHERENLWAKYPEIVGRLNHSLQTEKAEE